MKAQHQISRRSVLQAGGGALGGVGLDNVVRERVDRLSDMVFGVVQVWVRLMESKHFGGVGGRGPRARGPRFFQA